MANCSRLDAVMRTRNNQRDMSAGFGAELLCPEGVIVPVVCKPEDEGVLKKVILPEVGQNFPGVLVCLSDGVVVVGVPLTEQGGVWKIRGRGDRIGINLIRPLSCVTFASCKLDLTEPRFALRKAAPCTEIPSLAFDAIEVGILKDEVVVFFSAVEGEVALLSENLGDRRDPLGELTCSRLGPGGPVIVQTRRCLIGAGDHCGSARRADRRRNIAPGKPHSCCGECVNIGRFIFVDGIPIATKQGGHVFNEDPENVWLVGGCLRDLQDQKQ